ncbi:MAG: PH domain-containing protein [Oscillospiraceae bacterium]|nr:PH domain-containing protein [Oscillospiraceae bacterium]
MTTTSDRTVKQHPLKLFSYTTNYFWLLIIPLIRSLYSISLDVDSLRVWLMGTWMDLLVIAAILIFAWRRWEHVYVRFDDRRISVTKGKIYSTCDVIYYDTISSLSVNQSLFLKLFGACNVTIGTNAGALSRASDNISLTLRKSDADRLYARVKKSRAKSLRYSVTPNKIRLVLYSFISSSTLSGTVVILAFLYETSRMFDREVEAQLIMDTLSDVVNRASAYVSPVVAGVSVVLIVGWLVSFVTNIFYFWSYSLTRCSDSLYIKSGLIERNRHILALDKINSVDLRQNLISKLLRISSLHCDCAGYGETGRSETSVVMPIATEREINSTVVEIFPTIPTESVYHKPKLDLKPTYQSYWMFYYAPLALAILPLTAFFVLFALFPSWRSVIRVGLIVAEIPAIWLIIVKTLAIFKTGIAVNGDYITMRYSSFYTFHTVVVPKDRIVKVMIKQTYLQNLTGNCSAVIYTASSGISKHVITGLRLNRALAFFEKNGVDLYFE